MTQAVQTAQLGNTNPAWRNRIINGGMVIDQRNAGASVTPTTDGTYTLDRWTLRITQASKLSIQQNAGSVTPPTGFVNYYGATSLSAYSVGASDWFNIRQLIEGYNVADFGWGTANAKTVTLSFWVRSSLTGTFGGAINNNAFDRSYPFTYTISSANTWEQKTVTIPGDTTGTWLTTTGIGVAVTFGLGVGSSYLGPAGAWAGTTYLGATGATSVVGTNGATFYITGVQLEVGTAATSFEFRDYGRELFMCQRYYQIGGAGSTGISNAGGTIIGFGVPFKVPMRANATAALRTTSIEAGDAFVAVRTISSATINYANTGYTGTDNGMEIQMSTWSTTANKVHVLYTNCIAFSAEL